MFSFRVVAASLLLTSTPVLGRAPACTLPDRIEVPRLERPDRGEPVRTPPITGYLLSLSWSPQHCANVRDPNDARDQFQCGNPDQRFGWVLHGLWPESSSAAYPQWCRPARIVPVPVLRQNLCMTPSAQLLQHEWAKHGICMSPHPAAYFDAARTLFTALHFPDMALLARREQTVASVKRAFAEHNRGVAPAMLAVSTDRQGWLKELRLCLNRRMRPAACQPHQRGAPDRVRVRVRIS